MRRAHKVGGGQRERVSPNLVGSLISQESASLEGGGRKNGASASGRARNPRPRSRRSALRQRPLLPKIGRAVLVAHDQYSHRFIPPHRTRRGPHADRKDRELRPLVLVRRTERRAMTHSLVNDKDALARRCRLNRLPRHGRGSGSGIQCVGRGHLFTGDPIEPSALRTERWSPADTSSSVRSRSDLTEPAIGDSRKFYGSPRLGQSARPRKTAKQVEEPRLRWEGFSGTLPAQRLWLNIQATSVGLVGSPAAKAKVTLP
jgi:hypothetical protein